MNKTLFELINGERLSKKNEFKKKMSKAQMQLAIIKKKQCDAKALIIVERLLETDVNLQWLLQNLQYINKCHMEDVIEERAILKLCGYVLCKNLITVVITQQYHISVRRNKVYDVSRRKNFCSSHCFAASNYLLEQLLTSPLWLREKEEVPVFKLLPVNVQPTKNILGDEIIVGRKDNLPNVNETKDQVKESSKIFNDEYVTNNDSLNYTHNDDRTATINNDSEHTRNITTSECRENNLETVDNINDAPSILKKDTVLKEHAVKNDEFVDNTDIKSDDNTSIKNDYNLENRNEYDQMNSENRKNAEVKEENKTEEKNVKSEQENCVSFHKRENKCIKKKKLKFSQSSEQLNVINENTAKDNLQDNVNKKQEPIISSILVARIEQSVKEWITEDTLRLLLGKTNANELMQNINQEEKYIKLCKKLDMLQFEEKERDRKDYVNTKLKPLPHFSDLQQDVQKINLKVQAFYKGHITQETLENTPEGKEEKDGFHPILPLIDIHSPKILQRKIFLDKLHKILPDLLRLLVGNTQPYFTMQYAIGGERYARIKTLINTFSLTASNIVFKSAEWTLIGLIIIKLLSIMDHQLKVLLRTKQALMYISMIITSYKLDSNYLDRFIIESTNNPKIFEVNSVN